MYKCFIYFRIFFTMIGVNVVNKSDNDTDQIVDDDMDEDESQLFESTSLRIQKLNSEIEEVSKKQEKYRRRTLHRLVGKNGCLNVRTIGLGKMRQKRLKDCFTTFLEWGWFSTLTTFSATYFLSWFLFALLWHLLMWVHGDLNLEHLPKSQEEYENIPCVFGIENFASSFLFSMEIQTSIGFGLRVSSHKCTDAVILQCVQTVIGILIDAAVIGLFFVKVSRPRRRALTVVFSKNAVITKRNGLLRLIFQVANIQTSQLIETHFRGQVLLQQVTQEGEVLDNHQREIRVSCQMEEDNEDRGLFLLPIQVSHTIDKDSPLYKLSPEELLRSKMEFIFSMEAVVEPSGNTTQALTSYLPDEILWGCRFTRCLAWDEKGGVYRVQPRNINNIARDDQTPWLSARQLDSQG